MIGGVRHRRVQIGAIAPLAFGQGGEELVIAVQADTVLFVRRDVGAINGAERRDDWQAAGIRRATGCGVAGHAVGRARQVFALLDLLWVCCQDRLAGQQRNRQAHGTGNAAK
ncbi:hypothetical protein D3C76_1572150 [compost metagenome]